ncbi:hypothetical protein FRC03_008802 [Tulasnella sp. 419]|nr:hypothetical protein FRC03_008802 [Tulasnella sp. 419]
MEYVVSQVRGLWFNAHLEHPIHTVEVQGLTLDASWNYYKPYIPSTKWGRVLRFEVITRNTRPFLPLLCAILPTTGTFRLLKSLRITGRSSMSLSDVDLPARLACFPLLEEIWLEKFSRLDAIAELKDIFNCFGTLIIDAVSVENEARWICPNLAKIELHELALDVPDLLEMLRRRRMVNYIPGTPPVEEGPATPLKLLVIDKCCTFSDSSSCGELVIICNQQFAGTDEISCLVSYGECNCTHLEGAHTVIEVTQKND